MTQLRTLLLFAPLFGAVPQTADAQRPGDPESFPRTFYVAAGASGNGLDAATPFGSTEEVEAASAPGDIIVVLAGVGPLDGGLALKPGQTVRGMGQGSPPPVITNGTADRHGGIGVVLSNDTRIEGVQIRDTHASGIFGQDIGRVAISDVSIQNANTGRGLVVADPLAPIPHGGIALLASPGGGSQTAILSGVRIVDAAGMGVGATAVAGSQVTLQLHDVEITGGAGIGNADYGIAVLANGPDAEASLEMTRSRVSGRLTPAARNVFVAANNRGTTRGLIYESVVGESGQDGVLAVLGILPASVDVSIVGSTIENGAQSNVEGTMLAFPHEADDLLASTMAISVHRSTIRGAGRGPLFGDGGANVLMTGSFIPPGQALPAGRYSLRITDSDIERSSAFGLVVGTSAELPMADPGRFQVLVRGTRFVGNRVGDIMIGAPDAQVDARGNCWSSSEGTEDPRVTTYWIEGRTPADTSARIRCEP